jgi:hypothetical protein
VDANTGVITVLNASLTCTISASKDGDGNYLGPVEDGPDSVTLLKAAQAPLVLTVPASIMFGTTGTATTTGGSGTGVRTFSAGGTGGCSVDANTGVITVLNATLTCTISASKAGDSNYLGPVTDGPDTVTLTARPALVSYIGQLAWVTSGTSSTTAQVALSASVQDPTGAALSGAKMDFIDALTNKVLAAGVPVSPVAGSSSNTGTANKIVTLSTGQYGAESYLILVKMTGNYDNAGQVIADKTATVVVSKPAGTNEAAGAGTIQTLAAAAGTLRGANYSSVTYTVGMKYNKGGSNPQGKITLELPQADGSIVYIRSNSISSMQMVSNTNPKKMTIYTKASISRLLTNGTTVTIDGGSTLRMDIEDITVSPDNPLADKVGFTVLSSKDSQLFYSNQWVLDSTANAWKTVVQLLKTGCVKIN